MDFTEDTNAVTGDNEVREVRLTYNSTFSFGTDNNNKNLIVHHL